MRYLLLIGLQLLTPFFLISQCGSINGELKDDNTGEALIFATVAVYRNGVLITGTDTDIHGRYDISCCVGDKLQISYLGYADQNILVTHRMIQSSQIDNNNVITPIVTGTLLSNRDARIKRIFDRYNISPPHHEPLQVDFSNINRKPDQYFIKKGEVGFKKEIPWYTTTRLTQNLSLGWVQSANKPALQHAFTRGLRDSKGSLIYDEGYFGSWGPDISTLDRVLVGDKVDYVEGGSGTLPFTDDLLRPVLTYGLHLNSALSRKSGQQQWVLCFDYDQGKDLFNIRKNSNLGITIKRLFNAKHMKSIELNYTRSAIPYFMGSSLPSLQLRSAWLSPIDQDLSNETIDHNVSYLTHPREYGSKYNGIKTNSYHIGSELRFWTQEFHLSSRYQHSSIHDPLVGGSFLIGLHNLFVTGSAEGSYYILRRRMRLVTRTIFFNNYSILNIEQDNEYAQATSFVTNDVSLESNIGSDFTYEVGLHSLLADKQPSSFLMPDFSFSFNHVELGDDILRVGYRYSRIPKRLDAVFQNFNTKTLFLDSGMGSNEMMAGVSPMSSFLFVDKIDKNETLDKQSLDLNWENYHGANGFEINFLYDHQRHQNVIAPLAKQGGYELTNVGDYELNQLQLLFKSNHTFRRYSRDKLFLHTETKLAKFRTKVTRSEDDIVVLAGFANASKHFEVGQPLGIIKGFDYQRDATGRVIIGGDGFPLKNEAISIIGDPTPDLIFTSKGKVKWRRWALEFQLDGQIGGDIWNGTQQDLDFYGRSEITAKERLVENYVFDGVNQYGEDNNIPVDFYGQTFQQNRWLRYGQSGIAADYIENASHLILRSLQLAYKSTWGHHFSDVELSIQANNIVTIAGFRGFTDAGLWNDDIGKGLIFYNTPIVSSLSIGLTMTY